MLATYLRKRNNLSQGNIKNENPQKKKKKV